MNDNRVQQQSWVQRPFDGQLFLVQDLVPELPLSSTQELWDCHRYQTTSAHHTRENLLVLPDGVVSNSSVLAGISAFGFIGIKGIPLNSPINYWHNWLSCVHNIRVFSYSIALYLETDNAALRMMCRIELIRRIYARKVPIAQINCNK